ncbi:unnamed protein product [Rotaria sp. Silwood2]|nr:unnamed protein product [Rotaria sp. Silwood2]CAF4189843.1 unnamed protein product [Rotaria sp. Silwood2]
MSLLNVIVFLLIVSAVVVDSRARRKRRQASMSSSYFGAYGLGSYPNVGYGLGFIGSGTNNLRNNWYPLGNNWYIPNNQAYPYNSQFGYNPQPYPYPLNYGYQNSPSAFGTGQYGTSEFQNQIRPQLLAYIGQSYVPSNDWLPLPGVNRHRQLFKRAMATNMNDNRAPFVRK